MYFMPDMNSLFLIITGTECLLICLAGLGIRNVQWRNVIVVLAWTVHWLIMYTESMLCGMCVVWVVACRCVGMWCAMHVDVHVVGVWVMCV